MTGSIATEQTWLWISAVATVDVVRIVVGPSVVAATSASPSRAETTHHQSCEEQCPKDGHFATVYGSNCHADRNFHFTLYFD